MFPNSTIQKNPIFFPLREEREKPQECLRDSPPENLGGRKRAGKKLLLPPRILSFMWKESCQNVHELLINTVKDPISGWTAGHDAAWRSRVGGFHWFHTSPLNSRCVDPPEEHICYDILSLRFGTIEPLFHTLPPLFRTHGRQGDISNERLKGSSLITSTNIALAATLSRPSVTVSLSALKIR